MTPHPLSQSRQMAATLRFIAERKNTVAPRAQSVGVDPLSSTDTQILSQHRQQIGPVAVTFTIGRIQSRSPLLAAGAGDPANLPAAAASQGGGLCVFQPFHLSEVTDD